ncbi:hypothetical protein JCM24511_03345 [Saitozyma sp. JCM 24511]|nr:hypothetical protein JCM24511_03345 [Saitozyma sp. JCM 24511]
MYDVRPAFTLPAETRGEAVKVLNASLGMGSTGAHTFYYGSIIAGTHQWGYRQKLRREEALN